MNSNYCFSIYFQRHILTNLIFNITCLFRFQLMLNSGIISVVNQSEENVTETEPSGMVKQLFQT